MNLDRRTYLLGCLLAGRGGLSVCIQESVTLVDEALAELQKTCEHQYSEPFIPDSKGDINATCAPEGFGFVCVKCGLEKKP